MKQQFTATEIPHITPTSVGDLICSKRFWTLRVLKQWPPRPPQSYGQFGTAIHSIVKEIFSPQNAPLPNLNNLDVFVREAFYKHRYADGDARAQDMERAYRMVCGYVEQADEDETNGTIATEQLMERPIFYEGKPLFVLSAVADRLIVMPDDPDRLVILDVKTGRPKIDLWQACVLLAVAKLSLPTYQNYELVYDWVDEGGRVDRDRFSTASVKGVWPRIMKRVVEVLTAEEHFAEPNDGCVYCPLRQSCQPLTGTRVEDVADLFDE